VVRRARVLAHRSALVRIRPLPIVIPAKEVMSVPAPGQAGWIRFRIAGGRSARAAGGGTGCVKVPVGPKMIKNNFVAVGYSPNSPDGFLGQLKINLIQCHGLTGGIYATPVSLNQAVSSGSVDLGAGFVQKAGASVGASKAFSWPIGKVACSRGASATLSAKVALGIVPTLKVEFSGLGVSSALFKVDASTSATVGFDVTAGAQCSLPPTSLLTGYPNGLPIATFEGSIGPFPVVIELRGQLDLSGSVKASADASDQITATADLVGGIQYVNGHFSPVLTPSFGVTHSGLTARGTADAFAMLTPKIQALFYGVAGPEVDLHAGVQLHADSAANPWCSLTAPVAVDAVFDALGHTSGPLNIYQQRVAIPIAACNGPFGHPSGTGGGAGGGSGGTGGGNGPSGSVSQITAGDGDACALLSSGSVDCWGGNSWGSLGDGSTTSRAAPVRVLGLTTASQISAGYDTCAILTTSTVDCWGSNDDGMLGDGSTTAGISTTPAPVQGITDATEVSAGYQDVCAVLSAGGVDCWGYNAHGNLGDGTSAGPENCAGIPCSTTPVPVSGITSASQVAVGDDVACALLRDGTVDCWGDNDVGELGNGSSTGPTLCNGDPCSMTPIQVSGITGATQISIGQNIDEVCARLADGTAKCWGYNADGELGDGSTTGPDSCGGTPCSTTPSAVSGLTSAEAVSVGRYGACAALTSGGVVCWGVNNVGELGDGTNGASTTPVPVSNLSGATEVTADVGACALLGNVTVDCWGDNGSGELGNGSTTNSDVPVPVSTLP
jgi:alpha-tubulin suppressor-like RCC1 family protein